MKVKAAFDHYNFNVYDLEKSMTFYKEALGFTELRRKEAEDGSFILVYLTDHQTSFTLELTWLREWEKAYELGDNEVHLCVRVAGDYDEIRAYHKKQNWICFENTSMGLYFIQDPDGHWIEVLKQK